MDWEWYEFIGSEIEALGLNDEDLVGWWNEEQDGIDD